MLAVGLESGDIIIYNNYEKLGVLNGSVSAYKKLIFHPCDNTLYTILNSKCLVWDLNTFELRYEFPNIVKHNNIEFLITNTIQLLLGCRDNTLRIYDTATYEELSILNIDIKTMCLSPDNKILAICTEDSELIYYDIENEYIPISYEDSIYINSICFSPDCKKLICNGGEAGFQILDSKSLFPLFISDIVADFIIFSKDSTKLIVIGIKKIHIYSTDTFIEIITISKKDIIIQDIYIVTDKLIFNGGENNSSLYFLYILDINTYNITILPNVEYSCMSNTCMSNTENAEILIDYDNRISIYNITDNIITVPNVINLVKAHFIFKIVSDSEKNVIW